MDRDLTRWTGSTGKPFHSHRVQSATVYACSSVLNVYASNRTASALNRPVRVQDPVDLARCVETRNAPRCKGEVGSTDTANHEARDARWQRRLLSSFTLTREALGLDVRSCARHPPGVRGLGLRSKVGSDHDRCAQDPTSSVITKMRRRRGELTYHVLKLRVHPVSSAGTHSGCHQRERAWGSEPSRPDLFVVSKVSCVRCVTIRYPCLIMAVRLQADVFSWHAK